PLGATYVENGIQMTYLWQTSLLPDNRSAAMNQMSRATLGISLPANQPATVAAFDDQGNTLDAVIIDASADATLWDQAVWDVSIWDGSGTVYRQRSLNWNFPWIYKQAVFAVTGNCGYPLRIGDFYMINRVLGYDRLELTG